MLRTFTALLLLMLSCSAPAQNARSSNLKIRIPTSWIESVKSYDFKQNNSSLLRQFDNYIKPHFLDTSDNHEWGNLEISKSHGGLLSPIFADLDEELGEELVCLLGWDDDRPSIGVFKKISNVWYLLYLESFYTWYDAPDLYIANNHSRNKTFYLRRVYDHGSGIYSDGFGFYKLINNKVYHCLELVNTAHNDIWGMHINQEATLNFRFSGTADAITGDYNFAFSLGGADDCEADSFCPPLPFLSGRRMINYEWNSKLHSYKLAIPDYDRQSDDYLRERQIACFGAFGADSLFASAFRNDINKALKTGTPRQKKLLTTSLQQVKNNK